MVSVPRPGEPATQQQAREERIAGLLGPERVDELEELQKRLWAFRDEVVPLGVQMHWSIELAIAD